MDERISEKWRLNRKDKNEKEHLRIPGDSEEDAINFMAERIEKGKMNEFALDEDRD